MEKKFFKPAPIQVWALACVVLEAMWLWFWEFSRNGETASFFEALISWPRGIEHLSGSLLTPSHILYVLVTCMVLASPLIVLLLSLSGDRNNYQITGALIVWFGWFAVVNIGLFFCSPKVVLVATTTFATLALIREIVQGIEKMTT